MSLGKTWYSPQQAEEKFGVEREKIVAWALEGLIRFEKEEGVIVRVNADDLALEVENYLRKAQNPEA